jgi:phosphotriesterase-related protein
MPHLYTTHGPLEAGQLGPILPHEHIFVDLRLPTVPDHGQAAPEDVIALMVPELKRARKAGITALVECTPVGVGRRADLVLAVAKAAKLPVVLPTGIYRAPWIPDWAYEWTEHQLLHWMRLEIQEGINDTGIPAGFIKLSAGDDGMTSCEAKILRAAAQASHRTGVAIASHTIRGEVVRNQLDILAEYDLRADRFIWVHAQVDPDVELNVAMARRGAWIEYDGLGWGEDDTLYLQRIQRMLDEGLGGQVLLSMDRGWYDPAQPGGGTPKPYTYLTENFLPKLRAAGVAEDTIHQLTVDNPFRAFSR